VTKRFEAKTGLLSRASGRGWLDRGPYWKSVVGFGSADCRGVSFVVPGPVPRFL